MIIKRMPFIAVLAAALLTGGLAQAKPDAWITTKVKAKLAASKDVSAIATNVDTKEGVVTLRGEVGTQAEKKLAERHAASVQGVRRVDNMLVVIGDPERDNIGEARDAVADGRDGRGYGDKALATIDDATITARVKAALMANKATKARRINVDTKDGAVVLRGTSRSEPEKTLAEELARAVDGVKSVDNQITVR